MAAEIAPGVVSRTMAKIAVALGDAKLAAIVADSERNAGAAGEEELRRRFVAALGR